MTFDITQIIIALIGLIAAILTLKISPLVKGVVTKQRFEQLQTIAHYTVLAAQQLCATGIVKNKLEWATSQINNELSKYGILYDDQAIRSAIEAAVLALKKM